MKLSPRQIQRLQKLRRTAPGGPLSYDQFNIAIGSPFRSQTLLNALKGKEVNPSTYHFLVGILLKYAPEEPAPGDGKTAAAGGESREEFERDRFGTAGPIDEGTKRGSR